MSWDIDLKARTAERDGVVVHFNPVQAGGRVESDCFRDQDGVSWRGKFTPASVTITNEALRMRTLFEAVGAYGKAARRGPDPFPADE